jgi:hypothetical protein
MNAAIRSRFEALRAASTPLIGREEEIALLTRRWERAKAGDGSVVLIVGEPGIGKSRIAQTLLEQLDKEPHTRLRFFCSPHHQHSALYPSIAQLEHAAGLRREDTPETRLDKLAVLALANRELSEAVPLLADLLSIPTGDRYPPLNFTPQKRKEKTLDVQVAQVGWLSHRRSFGPEPRGRVPGRRLPCRGFKQGQLLCLAMNADRLSYRFRARALKSRSRCQIPPLVSRARRRRLRSLWRCAAEMRRESRAILPCPRSSHSG